MTARSDNYVSIIPVEQVTFLDRIESDDYNHDIAKDSVSVATEWQIMAGAIAACCILAAGLLIHDGTVVEVIASWLDGQDRITSLVTMVADLNLLTLAGAALLMVVLYSAIKLLQELAEFVH